MRWRRPWMREETSIVRVGAGERAANRRWPHRLVHGTSYIAAWCTALRAVPAQPSHLRSLLASDSLGVVGGACAPSLACPETCTHHTAWHWSWRPPNASTPRRQPSTCELPATAKPLKMQVHARRMPCLSAPQQCPATPPSLTVQPAATPGTAPRQQLAMALARAATSCLLAARRAVPTGTAPLMRCMATEPVTSTSFEQMAKGGWL